MVADPQWVETAAMQQLRALLTPEERERGALSVVVRSDAVADEIVSYARSNGVDLIVLGAHRRSGIARRLKGSVAERVGRSAPCTVLTIRSHDESGVTFS